mgnify:CR=1 FL=1
MPSVLGTNALAEVAGAVTDFFEKLAGPDGTSWIAEFKKFLRKEPCWVKTADVATSIIRLISGGRNVAIRATTGTRTIAQATDVFTWGIDPDFTGWGLDVPGEAKPETPVEVHEMVKDGDFRTIFGSLGHELDGLCLTQEQVIAFVEDRKDWLRKEGFATFFLLKVGGKFFVASVGLDSGERPVAFVIRFSRGFVWDGVNRPRIVVPQALES